MLLGWQFNCHPNADFGFGDLGFQFAASDAKD